uniref:F-box domain-containing protein n=1 Tax=Arundo donax TaxID=35708 RepID=A0A0A8ZJA3_ARUDO
MEPAAKPFDDLVGEIFLRLSPDDPAFLLRASLVCKRWRRILADPAFHRRHRELHRTPPVLGFLRIVSIKATYISRFVSNNPASPPAATSRAGSCSTAATAALSSPPQPKSRVPLEPWTSSSGTP